MMTQRDAINNEYFEWMVDLVCSKRFSKSISFRKLLMHLHSTEFTYTIKRDSIFQGDLLNICCYNDLKAYER